jgi:hypothetical protein
MSRVVTANRPLDEGLVLDLRFSEGVGVKTLDVSGYRNHGTLVGNATWITEGIDFPDPTDEVMDAITIQHHTSLVPTNACTIAFRCKLAQLPAEGVQNHCVFYKAGQLDIFHRDVTQGLYVRVYHDGTNTLLTTYYYFNNTEHHFVIVITTNKMKLYLDGELYKEGNISLTAFNDTGAILYIGSRYADRDVDGWMNDIQFWNRALSAEEVATLYGSRGRI